MPWQNSWPKEYRRALQELALNLSLTEIHLLRELTAGGGAKTYLATASTSVGLANRFILKIGDESILDKDISGLNRVGHMYRDAVYILGGCVTANGITCIPMKLAGHKNGITLEDFYKDAQPDEVCAVIKRLFDDTMRSACLGKKLSGINAFRLYKFHDMDLLARQLRFIGDDIPTLVDWWDMAANSFLENSLCALCHGDLHSRNVIVSGVTPYVIDFGETGEHHALRDLAKLEREITLFLYSCNNPEQDVPALMKKIEEDIGSGVCSTDNHMAKACKSVQTLRELAQSFCRGTNREESWDFEYRVALLAQFMFAAGNIRLNDIPRRKAALRVAQALRERLISHCSTPEWFKVKWLEKHREMAWRLAYSFLRLDQLPAGGWGKTLPQWMEHLWEGDLGSIPRTPEMYKKGGTDLSTYALWNYVEFLNDVFRNPQDSGKVVAHYIPDFNTMIEDSGVLARACQNMESKIGQDGGIGTDQPARGGAPALRIRHTIMGLITFITCNLAAPHQTGAPPDKLERIIDYLNSNLGNWKRDTSHIFGMFAAGIYLSMLLKDKQIQTWLSSGAADTERAKDLERKLEDALIGMKRRLAVPGRFEPRPPLEQQGEIDAFFSVPYQCFWRMERSNFLMYLPFLLDKTGSQFSSMLVDNALQVRCAVYLQLLLNEINSPFDPLQPDRSLVRYHRDLSGADGLVLAGRPVPDWGLSVELAVILQMPAIRDLLLRHNSPEQWINDKLAALEQALLETFADFFRNRTIFRFSHAASYSRFLKLCNPRRISQEHVLELDRKLSAMLSSGVTEHGIYDLAMSLIVAPAGDAKNLGVDPHAITDFLVTKLVSGDHTPDGTLVTKQRWDGCVQAALDTTKSFYDGFTGCDGFTGENHGEEYKKRTLTTLISRIEDVCGEIKEENRQALDLGCGLGQYAELLDEHRFKVELVDYSKPLLEIAAKNLKQTDVPPRDFYHLAYHFGPESFGLVFACASLIHVPPERIPALYRTIWKLLKPEGVFFVNYKIGDHTLISLDGRYFAYYRDHLVPKAMLESAGFEIDEIALRVNRLNMYHKPKQIYWANYYCRKAMV